MINPPKTREEAEKRRYKRCAWIPKGLPFDPLRCAYTVAVGRIVPGQCSRFPWHGPAALYCKQHAKMIEKEGNHETGNN